MTSHIQPTWLNPAPWVEAARTASEARVQNALASSRAGLREFADLLSSVAGGHLEDMAQRARALTRHHFGRTISLYVPLYLSSYCPGGCAYCGFAADREQSRRRLSPEELLAELESIHAMGFEEILLLTGERCPEAGFDYLMECVTTAAETFHLVTVESFAMTQDEYRQLAEAGCTGVTLYQETYDVQLYERLHRWGPKRDFVNRLEAPGRALAAGIRTVGLGALLGLGDPIFESIALAQHVSHLQKEFWQGGLSVSFPRIRPQRGDFHAGVTVGDRLFAQIIFAFRVHLPDVPLVISTRESAEFRDGVAGIGISKMSVASRTTVGGYTSGEAEGDGQFEISDTRDAETFCEVLQGKDLQPVFKNWDATLRPHPRRLTNGVPSA